MNKYIHIERLEFIVTYHCNSRCKHCYVNQEKRSAYPQVLRPGLAVDIIDRIAQEYAPKSIMTFGGEPLLFPDTVYAVHQAAKATGIPRREIITNAGWPVNNTEFQKIVGQLSDCGVTDITISVDTFHQEHIPLAVVENHVKSLIESGIPHLSWDPCWVISKEHSNIWNTSTKSILQSLEYLRVPETKGNLVQPRGRALKWLSEFLPSKTSIPQGRCEDVPYTNRLNDIKCLSIEPNGDVAVCHEVIIGNAAEDDILEIIRRYNPYEIPVLKAILEGGVVHLAEYAHSQGVDVDAAGYYSICDMCTSLRRKLLNCKGK